MGMFSGPQRNAPSEDRGTYFAPTAAAYIGSSDVPIVTTTTASQSVAIRSTVDLVASLASELPIDVYTGSHSQRREVTIPDHLEDPGGDGTGRSDWGYRLLQSWLMAGNAFGDVIDRDNRGTILTCDLISADQVSPSIVNGAPRWYVNGRPVVNENDFKLWRVNPVPGRLLGLSPIEHHAATIGVSLATTRFGRSWFTDGAHPSGMLKNESIDLDSAQAATAKARFMASRGTREPVVLGKGWGWDEIQISPEESQFLQTAGMSEAQCARIFGPGFAELLGYETGSKMTYSNIVDRRQDLLVLSMNKWFRRYERILSLFTPPGQWVEINRDAMLESTTVQRYQAHKVALDSGWRTINEVREIENLKPVDWGDKPLNTVAEQTPAEQARDVAELIQKLYLGVGIVLTTEEAREIANQAGANLQGGLNNGNDSGA